MKEQLRVAVIIPAGPRDDIMDTLASVVHYTDPARKIIVIDDTQTLSQRLMEIEELSPDIEVIPAPREAPGHQGGLWVKLTAGYRWVLERYEPRILLRLDADALMLGYGLEEKAEQEFEKNSGVGILGACRIGPDGGRRDPTWAARKLRRETGPVGLLHSDCRLTLRKFRNLARLHGYAPGESALGGAYIHSYQAALDMYNRGWLNQPELARSNLGEDHIMSMITIAAGFELGEFSGPDGPMALKQRGLPAHPAELLERGKLVTHSVRYWQGLREREIRDFFAADRAMT